MPTETEFYARDYCRFFTYVNESLLSHPSYRALINLLDNYNMFQGRDEITTPIEINEQNVFLDYFMSSDIGFKLYTFLSDKGRSKKL